MKFFILAETPVDSGAFTATGEERDSVEEALAYCAGLNLSGTGRYAIQPYEPRAVPALAEPAPVIDPEPDPADPPIDPEDEPA